VQVTLEVVVGCPSVGEQRTSGVEVPLLTPLPATPVLDLAYQASLTGLPVNWSVIIFASLAVSALLPSPLAIL